MTTRKRTFKRRPRTLNDDGTMIFPIFDDSNDLVLDKATRKRTFVRRPLAEDGDIKDEISQCYDPSDFADIEDAVPIDDKIPIEDKIKMYNYTPSDFADLESREIEGSWTQTQGDWTQSKASDFQTQQGITGRPLVDETDIEDEISLFYGDPDIAETEELEDWIQAEEDWIQSEIAYLETHYEPSDFADIEDEVPIDDKIPIEDKIKMYYHNTSDVRNRKSKTRLTPSANATSPLYETHDPPVLPTITKNHTMVTSDCLLRWEYPDHYIGISNETIFFLKRRIHISQWEI